MKTMLTSLCLWFAFAVAASSAFAGECAHWFSWPCGITPATPVAVFAYANKVPRARAQAPVVSPSPAPAQIDPLYAACSDMRIAFPACPGH
jgi:hypothetical protein